MSVRGDKRKILQQLKFYGTFLKTVNEERFITTPKAGGWSYAELYAHVLNTSFLSLVAVDQCLSKTASIKREKPDWRVRLMLFLGRFPPGKYKVPAMLLAAISKISQEKASNELHRMIKKIDAIDANFSKYNPAYKVKHPRLGYLDAESWLRFMYVHTKHHQKQIKRIEKLLNQKG